MKISQALLLAKEAGRAERLKKAWAVRAIQMAYSKEKLIVKEILAELEE